MRAKGFILPLLFFVLLCSCKEKEHKQEPKSVAYPFIERAGNGSVEYQNKKLSLRVSDAAVVKPIDNNEKPGIWFDISYPQYKATIYCSYLPITKETFYDAVEDSYKLAFSHASRADGIRQTAYENREHNTSGIVYEIEGGVAVPIQFFVTDSVSNFFRGSLYYDTLVNPDSVAPVTAYLREDIVAMIESLEWRD